MAIDQIVAEATKFVNLVGPSAVVGTAVYALTSGVRGVVGNTTTVKEQLHNSENMLVGAGAGALTCLGLYTNMYSLPDAWHFLWQGLKIAGTGAAVGTVVDPVAEAANQHIGVVDSFRQHWNRGFWGGAGLFSAGFLLYKLGEVAYHAVK
jgi:hypothetical protein